MIRPTDKSITAIIPAYNEGARIASVLKVVTTYPGFKEVIVTDDGSTDNTEAIVKKYPVRYLRNDVNRGKGAAMARAVQASQSDIIFFCDADIQGLSHDIITTILTPVVTGEVDMFVSMRNHRIFRFAKFILHYTFLLGGERALTRELWYKVPAYYQNVYRIEAALNFYAVHYGKGFAYALFLALRQTPKERKLGLFLGLYRRIIMMNQVLHAAIRVRLEYLRQRVSDLVTDY